MFEGCAKLSTAPELPATALTNNCYNGMFFGCISLKTAPKLPATQLKESCYYSMFQGCTKLEDVPEGLENVEELAVSCYQQMFYQQSHDLYR